ncbi:hypothetical protein AADR41_02665 [Streptomyces sp. CLV115]|uniref:hypothetical protein n=1 Tax=Streptomyces sp. CLV115 TaxID=3138502 RepID=UPI00313E6AFD
MRRTGWMVLCATAPAAALAGGTLPAADAAPAFADPSTGENAADPGKPLGCAAGLTPQGSEGRCPSPR